ncbi:Hypothetical predicted protein [Lecanosticta acicola]|uniref:Uncharacterized protein n=1 Tax=Lecanosticta acicola TaxID=111012 RepID=A0AAI9E9H5_9PEZI|nr:Hypothetical predicted protein [Lecanosticta acicola]
MAVFRILDLAAELRNRIYEECLTHDRTRNLTANVALLRTCKKIHSEAQGVFEAESCFTISAVFELNHPTAGGNAFISGDVKNFKSDRGASVMSYAYALPESFPVSTSVKLQLVLSDVQGHDRPFDISPYYAPAHRFLFALSCRLTRQATIREFCLRVDFNGAWKSDPSLQKVFCPVQNISPKIAVKVSGLPDCVMEQDPNNMSCQGVRSLLESRGSRLEAFDYIDAYRRIGPGVRRFVDQDEEIMDETLLPIAAPLFDIYYNLCMPPSSSMIFGIQEMFDLRVAYIALEGMNSSKKKCVPSHRDDNKDTRAATIKRLRECYELARKTDIADAKDQLDTHFAEIRRDYGISAEELS